ncbi:hypothetical protein CcI6DRAFT_00884 [Frankia sp. CcI6]|nr:hypothetical protein CcI6DRAFT_00884 [Frankia sp. CcI6]KFB05375.1 Mycothiol maleylpyruvate isomerase N-terminal domain [Frankia sp. Allo2]
MSIARDTSRTLSETAADLMRRGLGQGRPTHAYLPFDLTVPPDTPPRKVLQVITACGGLLSSALATADPATQAWHWGPCDPEGFAAMGVAEILLHTWDIAAGLTVPCRFPAPLGIRVLRRLFPDAPDGDPAQVLLWCTGRSELDGRPRRTSWRWEATTSARPFQQPAPQV